MASRKTSTPAAAPAPSKAAKFLTGCALIAVGMTVYGVGIDARAVTWPAASTAAGTVGSWVDNLHQDDDQAPVAAAAVAP